MIVLPLDEADREAVLNFLLPELVRNGALIADCTVLHDRARVFVAERGGDVLGVMALFGDFVGLRSTSENTFRKLVGAYGGMLSGRTVWSIVGAEELAHIEAQAAIEWVEPTHAMLYDPIVEPVAPPLPETLARRLSVADLGLMRRFYQETGIVHWRPEALELGPAYGIVEAEALVGHEGLVAAAGSYYVTDWLGEVGMVGVLPRYRRRGYATLVSYLVARDILARAKKVCLHVVRANLAAHELYLKMGYRDVGEAFLLAWRV
jgi:GNAT superfamily N-acetyltransferase